MNLLSLKQNLVGMSILIAIIFMAIPFSYGYEPGEVCGNSIDGVPDCDCDDIPDDVDNCPEVRNGNCDMAVTAPCISSYTSYCDEGAVGFQIDTDRDYIGDDCDDSDGDADLDGDGELDLEEIFRSGVYSGIIDGLVDALDNCPFVYNPDQTDRNFNDAGDACDDPDFDYIYDANDNCPDDYNIYQTDTDEDLRGDACDNCYLVANFEQDDEDEDGIGDACSGDRDGDTIPDGLDNCPSNSNREQEDEDADGSGDVCDNCPAVPNHDQFDLNNNGIGDDCEVPLHPTTSVTGTAPSGTIEQGSGGCSLILR